METQTSEITNHTDDPPVSIDPTLSSNKAKDTITESNNEDKESNKRKVEVDTITSEGTSDSINNSTGSTLQTTDNTTENVIEAKATEEVESNEESVPIVENNKPDEDSKTDEDSKSDGEKCESSKGNGIHVADLRMFVFTSAILYCYYCALCIINIRDHTIWQIHSFFSMCNINKCMLFYTFVMSSNFVFTQCTQPLFLVCFESYNITLLLYYIILYYRYISLIILLSVRVKVCIPIARTYSDNSVLMLLHYPFSSASLL